MLLSTILKKGKGNIKTLGGHGNGGKFYMRGMFEESFLITFRNGKINGFRFDSESDMEQLKTSMTETQIYLKH